MTEGNDWRFHLVLTLTAVSLAIGVPSYWAFVNTEPMMLGFPLSGFGENLDMWVTVGSLVSLAAALYAAGIITGIVHPKGRLDE